MGNIVINSRFNPYTYDEMLKPALMETQAHQDVENNLSDLATKSNVWEEMANKESDPYAYNMYKNYSNDLQNKASQLSAQGLTPGMRQNMLQMKQRYTKEIVPIEQAYTKRAQLVDEQRKLQAQDNTTLFDRSAANMSLDELIKNPNVTPVVQSGKDIEKRASDAFSHFAKDLKDDPTKYKHVMGGQYWEKVQRLGYRPEDIREAIMNDPNSSWALTEMRGQLLKTVPKEILANPANESKILNHINIGMASAIGTGDTKTAKDTDHDEYLKEKLFRSRQKPPVENLPLNYSSVDNLTIDGKVKTTELNEAKKWLTEMRQTPGLLKLESKRDVKTKTGFLTSQQLSSPVTEKETYLPNMEKLKKLSEQLGIKFNENSVKSVGPNGKISYNYSNNLKELEDKLQKEIETSAVRDRTYNSNATKDDLTRKTITDNSLIMNQKSGVTGLYNYENGEKKKMLTPQEVIERTSGKVVPTFDFSDKNHPVKLVTTDTKGNPYNMIIDPKLIDDSDNSLVKKINFVQTLLKDHRKEDAKIIIDGVMAQVRAKFNTKPKQQGEGASDKEIDGEMYSLEQAISDQESINKANKLLK